MQNIKYFFNRVNPFYFVSAYLLLLILLVFFKTKPYDFNLSSLIGIWKGFFDLNPNLVDDTFIVYNDGGYDGQFFYLVGKSLFTNGFESFPILDSFFLRFNRLGLPLLSGFISKLFGFNYYPIITLLLLTLFHIYSFVLLHKILPYRNKYLSLYYLFSPFSLNSILLLVSDSLFVSFSIFCLYIIQSIGINYFSLASIQIRRGYYSRIVIYILALTLFIFTLFIKETGLVVLGTFALLSILDKDYKVPLLVFIAIGFYLVVLHFFKITFKIYPGTNPLSFFDLIDFPFVGFYNSIQYSSISDLKSGFREMAKLPIFILYVLILLNLKNIKNFKNIFLFLPVLFLLFTAGVGEVGYWLSFDNISRMFTVSILWIILLRNYDQSYNDYYALRMSFIILIALVIRLVYIKSPMSFYIN